MNLRYSKICFRFQHACAPGTASSIRVNSVILLANVCVGAATPKIPHVPPRGLPQSHVVKHSEGESQNESAQPLYTAVSTPNPVDGLTPEEFYEQSPSQNFASRHSGSPPRDGRRLNTTRIEPTILEPFQASLPLPPSVISESSLAAQLQTSQSFASDLVQASRNSPPRVYSRTRTYDRRKSGVFGEHHKAEDLESLTANIDAVVPALELAEDYGGVPPAFRPLPQPRQVRAHHVLLLF